MSMMLKGAKEMKDNRKKKLEDLSESLHSLGFGNQDCLTTMVMVAKEPRLSAMLKYLKNEEYQTNQDIRDKAVELMHS